jgi:hypothetical protein
MEVTGIHVARSLKKARPGKFKIWPAQPPIPIAGAVKEKGFVGPNPLVYTSSKAYPSEPVQFMGQSDLAGQGMAWVKVNPVQYVPAEGKLLFYPFMEIVLTGVGGYPFKDCLPENISAKGRAAYERKVKGLVVNSEDVQLQTRGGIHPPMRGVEPGSFDHVIITQNAWVDEFQPLADWRTRCGQATSIVTTAWIYNQGGYVGTNLEKIRAFIQDAHANWGTLSFLLGGDSNIIPYHIRSIEIPGYWTEEIPNDTYYADYDEDWVCEVEVGRAPVRTVTQISTLINKVFTYEKNPPLENYATTAAFFGFDNATPGDQYGELSKEFIRSMNLPPDLLLQTEYDSEPGTHKADMVAYLNQGHHLVNHHDHCNADCMGAGWISHGDLFFVADANSLYNGDFQSILFAVGCNPCDFTVYKCVAEALVHNPSGGLIAMMGNTRTGWGGSLQNQDLYSLRQDRYFYRALFDEGHERLGACFMDLKNDEYDPNDPYNLHKACFTQLTLLGDPRIPIWTEDPRNLTVSHPGMAPAGVSTTFLVTVKEDTTPLTDVTVCLWKEGDLYEVQTTDASGEALFSLAPASAGTLLVTAACHNFLPYEGEASVVEGGVLFSDAAEIPESQGGVANLTLVAGQENASRTYLLLGSVTGTDPGTPLPGGAAILPLNWDLFTNLILSWLNSPTFHDFMGTLDGTGLGTAQLKLEPMHPGSAGIVMHFAYALNKPWNLASNPVGIEIVP